LTFLRSNVGLDDRVTPPRWLDERPSPRPGELLAFRNCLVDVTTGKTHGHDPRLWLHDGVSFNYDPKAKCPWWEWFLAELFPNDEEARDCIEEQLGYGMTTDNQFEKAALWIGPPRSGRGTIASIQELLVGFNGYCSLNLHTWHRSEFSRQGIIGKRVGIFHDIRLKPPKQYGEVSYDPGGVDPHSQQLLLELISGDLTEIGQKYLAAWKGKPFIKFILISNKVPNFNDEVLITRFNTIEFTRSFLGEEKPELKSKLLPTELPGIANRCLAAYRRLLERGRFIQPKSGQMLLHRVKAQVDPWSAFMDAYWEPDPGEGTRCKVFNRAFHHWCEETGTLGLTSTTPSDLIQKINRIPGWEWLESFRPRSEGPKRPYRYHIKLKSGVSLPEEVFYCADE
jgi:putative DNA primase/helicase